MNNRKKLRLLKYSMFPHLSEKDCWNNETSKKMK